MTTVAILSWSFVAVSFVLSVLCFACYAAKSDQDGAGAIWRNAAIGFALMSLAAGFSILFFQ